MDNYDIRNAETGEPYSVVEWLRDIEAMDEPEPPLEWCGLNEDPEVRNRYKRLARRLNKNPDAHNRTGGID